MPTAAEKAYLATYRVAHKADEDFQRELVKVFGNRAGSMRYVPSMHTPTLKKLSARLKSVNQRLAKALARMRKEGGSVAGNPKSSLKSGRMTPVRFTIKGKSHTGKAKLVGGKVKVYVTKNVARKVNPELDPTLVAMRQRYLEFPNGGPRLTVSPDGRIGDGYRVLASFKSGTTAGRRLKSAGFTKLSDGTWKAKR